MAFIEIDGKKVHVVELNPTGSDPVVMIHGLFTSLSLFFFAIASKLAKRRRVVLYDLRGHGLSEERGEGYTLGILSGDLFALMDALGIVSAHLAGYSFGGDVALHAAMSRPCRVRRIALIETPDMAEPLFAQQPEGYGDGLDAALVMATYSSPGGIPANKAKADRDRALRRRLFDAGLLQDALRDGAGAIKAMRMESLRAPALLLYGSKSPFLATGRGLARRIAGSELRVARGDHNLPVQRDAWVARRLDRFFGG